MSAASAEPRTAGGSAGPCAAAAGGNTSAAATAELRPPSSASSSVAGAQMSASANATPIAGRPTAQSNHPQPLHVVQSQQYNAAHHQHPLKTDEIEILESAGGDEVPNDKLSTGWICCAPCIWLRTSATVHKIAITTATLLVTSLLVASPVLFLLSTAPSQLPRECHSKHDLDCIPTKPPAPECALPECQSAALSLLARLNWKLDPCNEFRDFGCSSAEGSLKVVRSVQEDVDMQMHQLLTHNTTSGMYRKLGRLYGSCLRQTMNSTTIRSNLDYLGGYLPIGSLGPSTISKLMSKMNQIGPTPLISIYYDLSYGKQPQTMLVVDGSSESAPVLQMTQRWMRPKAPPHHVRQTEPPHLDQLLNNFLPSGLTPGQVDSEKTSIINFIRELNHMREETIRRDYMDSYLVNNVSSLLILYPFVNWTDLIGTSWNGPILLRSAEYLRGLHLLLDQYPRRVIHNSMLIMFAMSILPSSLPDPLVCTRATIWALPEVASAIYVAQFSEAGVKNAIIRTNDVFEILKAWLKRAPSLKGAALVKLSQLRVQTSPWPFFYNDTAIRSILDELTISSDDWYTNVLGIYKSKLGVPPPPAPSVDIEMEDNNQTAWAYPTVARIFYDALSHSIVVPLSVIQMPYFNARLPPYMHYASVGAAIATEILRSITKSFEDKLMQCVPPSVNIITNSSRLDILVQSGGMQIAYHSMLSLNGPLKGMYRLPGINLSPTQLFFLVYGQRMCAESTYAGVRTQTEDFADILGWLIAQGGSATQVFQCSYYSIVNQHKTCNVL